DNFFNIYEKEMIEKVEIYSTNRSNDDEELYINLWKDKYSLAIYLTSIEEIFTTRKEENSDTISKNDIKELVQVETLNEEQKKSYLSSKAV
ncbi:13716_t:CDS:1, partial [Racocetra persica]